MMSRKSLQDQFAPNSICFGCGPANAQGLQIKSYPEGEWVVAEWMPSPHHQAFPGMLNGGIIGSLLDCHANWAATWHLMRKHGWDAPHGTVTASLNVEYLSPTPAAEKLRLRAKTVESTGRRATVEAELISGEEVRARATGVFVAVKPGHPAYDRWS